MDVISGKIAIITGGATGIGAAYVKRLFKSGMKGCTIADINECGGAVAKEMNCCFGQNKAIFVKADVTNGDAFESVFKTNMERFHKLDVLVNNAGVGSDKDWEHMIDVNITSTVRGSLLGIKYMGKNNGSDGGTIVNTSDVSALQGLPGAPCHTGSKNFVIGFTRSIGTQFWFNLTGIRFMTICPGLTTTPMVINAAEAVFDGFPGLEKLLAESLRAETPQTVEDVAEGLNTMINKGDNGSIWVGRRADPIFEVVIPPIHKMMAHRRKC